MHQLRRLIAVWRWKDVLKEQLLRLLSTKLLFLELFGNSRNSLRKALSGSKINQSLWKAPSPCELEKWTQASFNHLIKAWARWYQFLKRLKAWGARARSSSARMWLALNVKISKQLKLISFFFVWRSRTSVRWSTPSFGENSTRSKICFEKKKLCRIFFLIVGRHLPTKDFEKKTFHSQSRSRSHPKMICLTFTSFHFEKEKKLLWPIL